jgi:betaine lipid synthase
VTVVCQDARTFRLEDYEKQVADLSDRTGSPTSGYFGNDTIVGGVGGAELVTLSYSLSMIVSCFFLSKFVCGVDLNTA